MKSDSSGGVRVEVRGLAKAYGERRVLAGLDFVLEPGQFTAVVGRSGCGKSTLLRLLAGLEAPDAGRVTVDGLLRTDLQANTRVMFQEDRLLPWRTVLQNVGLGLGGDFTAAAAACLQDVGLADRAGDWPGRLSGGQRQRVALARALAHSPRLLLLDEPLGALDALTRMEMQTLLETLWLDSGFTVVLVTHDVSEAVFLADRLVVLDDGKAARDLAIGLPRPRRRDTLEFVRLEAEIRSWIMTENKKTGAKKPDHCQDLRSLVDHWAAENPEAPWVVSPEDGEGKTFGQLAADGRRLAAFLKQQGLEAGTRVALMAAGGPAGAGALVGLMAAGYSVAPLGLKSSAAQLAYILNHSHSRAVFTGRAFRPLIEEAAELAGRPLTIIELAESGPQPWDDRDAGPWPDDGPAPDQEAMVIYTSGTTGRPKGVRLSQQGLVIGARNVAKSHDLGPGDRVLASLPFNHINAVNVTILAPLYSGGGVVLQKGHDPWNYWNIAAAHQCTWLNAVPTIIAMVLFAPDPEPSLDLSRLRFCRSASAPLSPAHHQEFEERFRIPIVETMGMTEMSGTVLTNYVQKRKIGSAGKPLEVECRVVDPESGRRLDDGQEGEIWFRGLGLMLGYLDDEAATRAAVTDDGWLRSGDLGRLDADGFIFITGRIKEIIIKGGENIAPRAIDEILLKHPAVLSAAAFGAPDPVYGQEVEAAVVLKAGAEVQARELRDFCRKNLSEAETPRRIHFVQEIPAGSSGKIQRLRLVEMLHPGR